MHAPTRTITFDIIHVTIKSDNAPTTTFNPQNWFPG